MGGVRVHNDRVSIVVPVFCGRDNLRPLVEAIHASLREVDGVLYEVLLIDDASPDDTWKLIRELRQEDSRVKGVRLSRRFGLQAASTAGYRYAEGDAVISMHANLEHPPELLPRMIKGWRMGYDIVSMVPENDTSMRLFYRVVNALSDVAIPAGAVDFRLVDRRVVRRLNRLKEKARFQHGLVDWTGFPEIRLSYRPPSGLPRPSIRDLVCLAGNAVTSFSSAPLRLILKAAVIINVLCVVLMGYGIASKLTAHKDTSEWASTFLTMLFLNALQFLMLGVLGAYLARIFDEVKSRPVFVTRAKLGIKASDREPEQLATGTAG